MTRSKYWKRRFDDTPKASQINKSSTKVPKRKVSPEEQEKINAFVMSIGERGKKLLDKHSDK